MPVLGSGILLMEDEMMNNDLCLIREEKTREGCELIEGTRELIAHGITIGVKFIEPLLPYIVLVFIICGVCVYQLCHPKRRKRMGKILYNTAALTFLLKPKFDPIFSKSGGPESMFEFLLRRVGGDYKKYRKKIGGRVLFWIVRILFIVCITFVMLYYYFGNSYSEEIFSAVVTIFSGLLFTVVLTGGVSYVLAYFGYLAVWDKVQKTDLAEMRECAISIWKNMNESGAVEGFKVRSFCDFMMAMSWTVIDKRKSILQIDFRIVDKIGELKNISDESSEMSLLLRDFGENWWDYRIVIKNFIDGSYSKMIDYENGKSGRDPVRVCEIDGNYRDSMKVIMEAVYMLKPSSMKKFEFEWRKIRKGYSFRNYDAESYR